MSQPRSKKSNRRKIIRILLVDDDPIVRTMMRLMFEKDNRLQFAGECSRAEEAARMVTNKRPDLVILDLNFSVNLSGLKAGPAIRAARPECAILVVSQFGDTAEQCRPWADGFLPKEDSTIKGALTKAIHSAMEVRAAFAAKLPKSTPALAPNLSEDQIQLLRLTAQGLKAEDIAVDLGVTKHVVDNRTKALYGALGWPKAKRNKLELTKFAIDAGIYESE